MGALALLALAGCRRIAPPGPALERLLSSLGPSSYVRIGDETRPAVTMLAGEARSCRVQSEPGSRLVFTVGILEAPEESGALRFTATAGGRVISEDRLPPAKAGRWFRRSATLEAAGPLSLEFRAEEVRPAASGDPEARARVALASVRLYRPRRGASRRTLLWISQDALRADHLGAYGYARPTSPSFDRLSRDWALFEDAVSPASWTLPSLASQMTSRYPSFHGAVLTGLATDEPTLFETLAKEGFTVLGVTGNDLVGAGTSLERGFDALWHNDGRAAQVNERLLSSLEERGGGDLALFVHYIDPHAAYRPPPPYDRWFDPDYKGPVHGGTNVLTYAPRMTPADWQHVVALYDGEILFQDQEIGRLLEGLEPKGLLRNAVIAYTSDHGEEFQEHGGMSHGPTLYQEVLHVPFALRIPGIRAQRVSRPVSLVDFAPTVLEAFGIAAPASFQGRSLLPLLRGEAVPQEPIVSETQQTRERHHLVSVRSGALKYILRVPGGREPSPPILKEELYDLAADPGEKANRLASPEAERLRRQGLAYLARARQEGRVGRPVEVDPATLEKLKAWGYIR